MDDVGHHVRGLKHALFADGMRAELQQDGVGREILIVIALADEDILDQAGIFLIGDGLDLPGEGAVDLAVLIAAAHQKAHLRGVLALDRRGIFVGIGDAVAMDIDDRVRALLPLPSPVLAGVAACARGP